MLTIIITSWFMIGFVSAIVSMKREYGRLEVADITMCAIASVFGPSLLLFTGITWIVNKF